MSNQDFLSICAHLSLKWSIFSISEIHQSGHGNSKFSLVKLGQLEKYVHEWKHEGSTCVAQSVKENPMKTTTFGKNPANQQVPQLWDFPALGKRN